MIKLEQYLRTVLQEVLLIKKASVPIKLYKLSNDEVKQLHEGLHWLLSFSTTKRAYNSFKELLSEKSPKEVFKKASAVLYDSGVFQSGSEDEEQNELSLYYVNELKNAVDVLPKLKRNHYYYVDYADKYVFTVGNLLYYLDLRKISLHGLHGKQAVELRFDEIKGLEDYPFGKNFAANKLFSKRSYGSVLFRKVAAVVMKEVPNWEHQVFCFTTSHEKGERITDRGTMRETVYKSALRQMFVDVKTKRYSDSTGKDVFAFSKYYNFEKP